MKYTNKHGQTYTTLYGTVEHDLYADLVAAIHIGHALEAKCERLEAELAQLGTSVFMLEDRNRRQARIIGELKAELDRLELVS